MDSKNNKETDARMKHWQQLSIEERLDVLEITSAKTSKGIRIKIVNRPRLIHQEG